MNKSIFSKIFTGYIIISILLVVLAILFALNPIHDFYIKTLETQLVKTARSLVPSVKSYLAADDNSILDQFIKQIGTELETRVTIITLDGLVLADSEEDPEKMENHAGRPEIQDAIRSSSGISTRFSETVEKDMLYQANTFETDEGRKYVIRTSLFINDMLEFADELEVQIIQALVIILIVIIVISMAISKNISRPVKSLASAFEKVADGDLSVRMHLNSKDEIRQLADNFNSMTTRIQELFTKLSDRKEELDHVILSINESLVLIEGSGLIILGNDKFKELCGTDEITKRQYWEVIPDSGFNELITRVRKEKQNIVEEVIVSDRNLLCSASYLSGNDEIVVISYDISELKKFEVLKKDLVVNVSHELRTPLTAIKGYVETLEEDIEGENKKYLEIISKHTDRLILTVQELMTLAEIEHDLDNVKKEEIDFKSMINRIATIFDQKILSKGLKLEQSYDGADISLLGDQFKLEQLFINLIDNAIKYTDEGTVEIAVYRVDKGVSVIIRDTGIGIDKKALERIFDRFYVVNKARSREMGGTGLGLSIVKHIVKLHNGNIDVISEPGKGTEFQIFLPEE